MTLTILDLGDAHAIKSKGTYNQKYGSATNNIVCGDKLCSEIKESRGDASQQSRFQMGGVAQQDISQDFTTMFNTFTTKCNDKINSMISNRASQSEIRQFEEECLKNKQTLLKKQFGIESDYSTLTTFGLDKIADECKIVQNSYMMRSLVDVILLEQKCIDAKMNVTLLGLKSRDPVLADYGKDIIKKECDDVKNTLKQHRATNTQILTLQISCNTAISKITTATMEFIDTDNDSIVDASDSCPNSAENYNGYQDTDGCPDTLPQLEIHGTKFFDINSDHLWNNEPPLAGWNMTLFNMTNMMMISSDITDANGAYTLSPPSLGTYTVCEKISDHPGWAQTYPYPGFMIDSLSALDSTCSNIPGMAQFGHLITVFANDIIQRNFGNNVTATTDSDNDTFSDIDEITQHETDPNNPDTTCSVYWLSNLYQENDSGSIEVIFPSKNLNPGIADTFTINVWSSSDAGGVDVIMTESGPNTGIFNGYVDFTNTDESSYSDPPILRVAFDDEVTAELECYGNDLFDYASIQIDSSGNPAVIVPSINSSVMGCETTNSCYTPYLFTTIVGFTITFNNNDGTAHTITSDAQVSGNPIFDSGMVMSGNSYTFQINTPGTYSYHCIIHPWATGQITVQ